MVSVDPIYDLDISIKGVNKGSKPRTLPESVISMLFCNAILLSTDSNLMKNYIAFLPKFVSMVGYFEVNSWN
jgi:hypothetical protein